MRRDADEIVTFAVGSLMALLALALLVVISVAIYFAFTGGFTTTHVERHGGMKCVVVRDRLDNSVHQMDCGKVRP